jgi:hypothetical protein
MFSLRMETYSQQALTKRNLGYLEQTTTENSKILYVKNSATEVKPKNRDRHPRGQTGHHACIRRYMVARREEGAVDAVNTAAIIAATEWFEGAVVATWAITVLEHSHYSSKWKWVTALPSV